MTDVILTISKEDFKKNQLMYMNFAWYIGVSVLDSCGKLVMYLGRGDTDNLLNEYEILNEIDTLCSEPLPDNYVASSWLD